MKRQSNSGYHPCPCRDCFEIAIGCDEADNPDLCHGCEAAGCEANADQECSAPHAYCAADSADGDVMVDGVAYCPVCSAPF